MNFTHMVLLKKGPWYIYSQSEDDALEIAQKYGDSVVGIVVAPDGLILKHIKSKVVLEENTEIKMIDHIQEREVNKILNDEELTE